MPKYAEFQKYLRFRHEKAELVSAPLNDGVFGWRYA